VLFIASIGVTKLSPKSPTDITGELGYLEAAIANASSFSWSEETKTKSGLNSSNISIEGFVEESQKAAWQSGIIAKELVRPKAILSKFCSTIIFI
jgi:hypothetical protein